MPNFRLIIEKTYGGETWVNRYLINAASLSAAVNGQGVDIMTQERSIMGSSILITKYRVDDMTPDTDVFATVPVNLFCLRTDLGPMATLFNTLRVDFAAAEGGRPSRKYYRGALGETVVGSFGTIEATHIGFIQTVVDNIASIVGLVDPDNSDLTTATIYPFVAMRQLHRRSKKKTTP